MEALSTVQSAFPTITIMGFSMNLKDIAIGLAILAAIGIIFSLFRKKKANRD